MSNAVNGSSAGHGPFADSEWQPVTDSASGHTYWWNVSTGETRWDTPESGTHSEEPVPGTEGAEDARSTESAAMGAANVALVTEPTAAVAAAVT